MAAVLPAIINFRTAMMVMVNYDEHIDMDDAVDIDSLNCDIAPY